MGIQMTQKAEPLSSSACLLCQGQCSSDWKKHNYEKMKPKIGERVLKRHLAARKAKISGPRPIISQGHERTYGYGPTLLSVVFVELC